MLEDGRCRRMRSVVIIHMPGTRRRRTYCLPLFTDKSNINCCRAGLVKIEYTVRGSGFRPFWKHTGAFPCNFHGVPTGSPPRGLKLYTARTINRYDFVN